MSQQTVPSQIITEAAGWLVLSQERTLTLEEQQQLNNWCRQSETHQRAWDMAQQLAQSMQSMPSKLGKSVLGRPQLSRRNAMKNLAVLMAIPTASWFTVKQLPFDHWMADMATTTGEQRDYQLADGSMLLLNTDTQVDVDYTQTLRRVHLRQGEVQLTSAKDVLNRPLIVSTPFGDIQALGTVFQVRHQSDLTGVSVQQHAVEVRTHAGQVQRLEAGQQIEFTAKALSLPKANPESQNAWTKGQLIADNMTLSAVANELSRYRHGWLSCDEEVANLRVSGVFQLNNTDIALQSLMKTLPIELVYRTRYWVMIKKLSTV